MTTDTVIRQKRRDRIRRVVERHTKLESDVCSCGWRRTPRDPVYWSDHVASLLVDL